MEDAGVPTDGPLRQMLHDYFACATTTSMAHSHHSADGVPENMSIQHWS
jgi:hemoglobin